MQQSLTTPKTATQFHHDAKQWQQIIRNNVGLYNLLGNFEFGKDVFSHDVRSSWLEQPMGQSWVACGDALLAFDPIAGQGLFNAIYTGMKAAETILSSTEYTHHHADYLTEINQIIKTCWILQMNNTNFISLPKEINLMAKTLQELLASRSPESQARIQKMADELLLENQLHLIREELEISQKELAETLEIKQPSLSAIENRGNDL